MIAMPVVMATGLYLAGLGAACFVAPERVTRFLHGFASSARTHYVELIARLIVGGAVVLHAPRMRLPELFTAVGWVLLVTTALMLPVPWRWHRRFARVVVPPAVARLRLLGLASLAMGGLVIWAAWPVAG